MNREVNSAGVNLYFNIKKNAIPIKLIMMPFKILLPDSSCGRREESGRASSCRPAN